MYIRTKTSKGRVYYQLVESCREGGKVKQHILASLGAAETLADGTRLPPDPREALKRKKKWLARYRQALAVWDRVHPPGDESEPARVARERAQLRRWVDALARAVEALALFLEQGGTVGTT